MFNIEFETIDGRKQLYAIIGCDATVVLGINQAKSNHKNLAGLKNFGSLQQAEEFLSNMEGAGAFIKSARVFTIKNSAVVFLDEKEKILYLSAFIMTKEGRLEKLLFGPRPFGGQRVDAVARVVH